MPALKPLPARLALLLLLAAGFGLVQVFVSAMPVQAFNGVDLLLVAAVAILSLVPAVNVRVASALDRLRCPSARTRALVALGVGLAAAALLLAVAFAQDRPLYPQWHDEQSYLVQMQMLARGRLWMPQHPVADFFDSFYLLVKPKYASMYFPGTALLFVPAVWLHLPSWLLPVAVSGAIVGLSHRIVTELLDGVAGLLAALLLLASIQYERLSTMVMSQLPLALMGLLLVWSWLRWREQRRARWALAMGAFAGWAALVRLSDAPCYALPVALAVLLGLRGSPARAWAATLGAGAAGALPFLLLQLAFNQGVTGEASLTPHRFYTEQSAPQATFGFQAYDPQRKPTTALLQKQLLYERSIAPAVRLHRPEDLVATWLSYRLPVTLDAALCHPLLSLFLPLGLLGLRRRGAWVVWAGLPLFIAIYACYAILQPYYPVAIAPALIFSVLLGASVLEGEWPARRAALSTFLSLAILALAASSLPGVARGLRAASRPSPTMQFVAERLPALVQAPAVVLFRYGPRANPQEEPVYNTGVAWPDDAPIVRAHDLGPERDAELARYFAAREPGRNFYLLDRETGELRQLGTAAALAAGQTPSDASR